MTTTSSPVREVTADSGARYQLGPELGRGGQGAVLATADGRWAVKLLFGASHARRERLRQRLSFVRRLDLQDVPIARPEETLRAPRLGYLMRRLTGMTPLAKLLAPPAEATVVDFYRDSGGLRRRLRLCQRLAQALAQLHGRGLCYGDLSPSNVFVSAAADAAELRLIDADNLHYAAQDSADQVYTPGYAAPELLGGAHPGAAPALVSTLTDVHALAVLCFQALRLVHPLCGDQVLQGEPELEEQAFGGALPYIDDPDDDRNRASCGLPVDLVLSPRLQRRFLQCFQAGLRAPLLRPTAATLAEDLRLAAGATALCPACGWSYYFTATACPDCEAPRPGLWCCEILLWDDAAPVHEESGARLCLGPDGKPRRLGLAVVCGGAPVVLDGTELGDGGAGLHLSLHGRELGLLPLDGHPRALRGPDGQERVFEHKEQRIAPRSGIWCRLELSRSPYRVLRCTYSGEVPRARA